MVTERRKSLDALKAATRTKVDARELWKEISQFATVRYTDGTEVPSSLVEEPNHEDRGTVLVLTAMLEQLIADAIRTHFVPLSADDEKKLFDNNGSGPLSGFANRVTMAYALGIIGEKSYKDLVNMNAIRNYFAHAKSHAEFSNEDVTTLISNMNHLETYKISTYDRINKTTKDIFVEMVRHYFVYFALESENDKPVRFIEQEFPDIYS